MESSKRFRQKLHTWTRRVFAAVAAHEWPLGTSRRGAAVSQHAPFSEHYLAHAMVTASVCLAPGAFFTQSALRDAIARHVVQHILCREHMAGDVSPQRFTKLNLLLPRPRWFVSASRTAFHAAKFSFSGKYYYTSHTAE